MDVSVIIVNYNTKQLTANCINSLFEQTRDITFEVILIDNDSSDGSVELFEKEDRVIFIKSEKNIGFGRANNLGYEISKGKYVLLLNSDTELINNAIKIFFDIAERMPKNIACFGCLLKNKNGAYSPSFGKFLTIKDVLLFSVNNYTKHFGLNLPIWNENRMIKRPPFEVEIIVGADLFIRREVVEKCGLFDPAFFMYHEENDLQRRYAEAGYSQVIIDGPEILHLEGRSGGNTLNKEILAMNGMLTYIKKWNIRIAYYSFFIVFVILRLSLFINPKYKWAEKTNYFKKLLFS
jgi:GT2 family glycosyltransferase